MWDYFVFIYMSHKFQNIKRRQVASGSLDTSTILYLRGADYQLAVSRKGAGVGHSTMEDVLFDYAIIKELRKRFNVVKALSPSDLSWAMREIGSFLMSHGNFLGSVAEFARRYDSGVFLNPSFWKDQVLELFPSASLFLVYVSNQSNGLSYELESLAARGLETHTIVVLDEGRFGSRESFFALQDRLSKGGHDPHLSVNRDACTVEDPNAFERLVSTFPHQVMVGEDKGIVLSEIEALIPAVSRREVALPAEFPFEFKIALNVAQDEQVSTLRRRVSGFIKDSLSQEAVANWPVLRLHIEMDVFLNLIYGRILDAALSTARYAAIADFTLEFVKLRAPERAVDLDSVLKQCGNIGMSIAYDAFAMGEWNDYSDRRTLSKERIDAAAREVIDLMSRSVDGAATIAMRKAKEDAPHADASTYNDLLKDFLRSVPGMTSSKQNE